MKTDTVYVVRLVSYSAVFTAIVFILTYMFAVYTPPTIGFFNIGEIGVYLSGLIGGPIVGAIAGGLGSAAADIALGYPHYAPGTLVIKAVEGFLVGFLYQKLRKAGMLRRLLPSVVIAIVLGAFTALSYPEGITWVIGPGEAPIIIHIPTLVILVISLVIIGICFVLALSGKEKAIIFMSCIIAGIEMVLGYFLYEAYVLGFGLVALAEIPTNLLQMIVGTIVAAPTVITLREAGVIVESQ